MIGWIKFINEKKFLLINYFNKIYMLTTLMTFKLKY